MIIDVDNTKNNKNIINNKNNKIIIFIKIKNKNRNEREAIEAYKRFSRFLSSERELSPIIMMVNISKFFNATYNLFLAPSFSLPLLTSFEETLKVIFLSLFYLFILFCLFMISKIII